MPAPSASQAVSATALCLLALLAAPATANPTAVKVVAPNHDTPAALHLTAQGDGPAFAISRTPTGEGSDATLDVTHDGEVAMSLDATAVRLMGELVVQNRNVLAEVDALKAEVDDLKRSVSHLTAENWHLKSLLASNATAIEDNANEIAKLENLHADVLHGPVCMTGAMGWQDIFYLRQFEFGLYWASGNNYGGSALLFIHNNWDGNSNYAANLQVISQGGDVSGYTWSFRVTFHDNHWYVQASHNQSPHNVCMTIERLNGFGDLSHYDN